MTVQPEPVGPVVSAAHLADGAMPALSEIEFSLTVLGNGFQRWIVRCMAAAVLPGLEEVDVLILHAVNHRDRDKTLSDLCMMLNIEDTHVVAYALKKLQGLSGEDFDRQYVQQMVKDHRDALKLVEKTAKDAKDPELKAHAQQGAPHIKEHLAEAQKLQQGMSSGAGGTSSKSSKGKK